MDGSRSICVTDGFTCKMILAMTYFFISLIFSIFSCFFVIFVNGQVTFLQWIQTDSVGILITT